MQEDSFYGAATVGEKGQIVIPAEAREKLKIQKGDKLLVFGMGCDMLAITKLSRVEKFASSLSDRLNRIREVIKKTKS